MPEFKTLLKSQKTKNGFPVFGRLLGHRYWILLIWIYFLKLFKKNYFQQFYYMLHQAVFVQRANSIIKLDAWPHVNVFLKIVYNTVKFEEKSPDSSFVVTKT